MLEVAKAEQSIIEQVDSKNSDIKKMVESLERQTEAKETSVKFFEDVLNVLTNVQPY